MARGRFGAKPRVASRLTLARRPRLLFRGMRSGAGTMWGGEYFGTEDQRRLQARAEQLWRLVRADPRFACYGRGLGLADPETADVAMQIAAARLVGVSAIEGVSEAEVSGWRRSLEEAGLKTDAYVEWIGGEATFATAEAVAEARRLPEDLALERVGPETPAETMAALDDLTGSCGMLLPAGSFIRGVEKPAACLFARDEAGVAVGASATVANFHPSHARGRCAWWGMLATREARRGEGIALSLGAQTLLAARDALGMTEVFTGVRRGNGASERLCARLGLAPTDAEIVVAIDPSAFGGDRVTA